MDRLRGEADMRGKNEKKTESRKNQNHFPSFYIIYDCACIFKIIPPKKVKIIFIIFPFAHCGRTTDSSPGSRASKEAQIPYVLRNFHERNARIFFSRDLTKNGIGDKINP